MPPNPGTERVTVIGGGLAGSEAAMMIARLGHPVDLYEMKPKRFSPAHTRTELAEIVCSNSLGNEADDTAPGLLKSEMRRLGSVILAAAGECRVPAGRALAVDRERFSKAVTARIAAEPRIRLLREECLQIPEHQPVVIATGPLTSDALAAELARLIGRETLYFYDSISPIVSADSIDYEKAYFGSRYEPDSEDYLNCPMDRARYEEFVGAIRTGEKVPVRDFEELRCFEGCLPIEVLADRGIKTLAFGPMKPVGLIDPKTGRRPYAVVQLRRENRPTTLYNMVGFQTRLKWGEQKRIFQMIPGLENGEFVRMGSMHRNTFIDSPRLLDPYLRLRSEPRIFVAGQLTGVEGYVESAAMGQWAGLSAVAALRGIPDLVVPPPETAFGALIRAITTAPLHGHFAPMNINFGLLPPPEHSARNKDERRRELLSRARNRWDDWQAVMTERLNGFSRLKAKRNPLSESFDAART